MKRFKFFLALLAAAAFSGCQGKSKEIQTGSTVKMQYTLNVDGQVVDSSQGKEPLVYVQGQGQIIPGLEEAMMGLKAGDKKQVTVSPEKGYGPMNPAGLVKVLRKSHPDLASLKVGAMVSGEREGQRFQAMVVAATGQELTLNMNHPLAGKTLNFDIEVVEVKPPAL